MKFIHPKRLLILSLLLTTFYRASSQSICIDSILIDGSITKYMKYIDFINTGIKIDSITSAKPMDSNDPDSIIYVGSSVFWYDSKRGTCDAKSIWFDKISTLLLGKYSVNKSTSHYDLRKIFPMDCKSTRPVKIYKHEGILQRCSIPVRDKKGQLWDMQIILFLKDDSLIRVDFWEPM